MKRIILTYGTVSGVVIIGIGILTLSMEGADKHLAGLEILGYLVMLLALSAIFIGIKRYRDQELGGVITFGTATLVGLGISLVASLIYVFVWELYLAASDHDFIGSYIESSIAAKQAEGVSAEELAAYVEKMQAMRDNYRNVLFRTAITFTEIFPVGLVITLISAAILRRRAPAHAGSADR